MLGTSNNFKPSYTKEDLQGLEEWFKAHPYHGEMEMSGGGIRMSDVGSSVERLLEVAEVGGVENRTYAGTVNMLYAIRDQLLAQGKVKE